MIVSLFNLYCEVERTSVETGMKNRDKKMVSSDGDVSDPWLVVKAGDLSVDVYSIPKKALLLPNKRNNVK